MRNLLPIALFTLMLSPLAAFAQQQFSTPEQAASALAEALSQQNEAALSKVLGDNWQQFLPTDGIDPSAVDRFQRDWQVKHVIVQQGDNAWLDVGSEAWRLPVPIVKTSQGWRFDMAAGEEEILTRAIGRNELSAIAAIRAPKTRRPPRACPPSATRAGRLKPQKKTPGGPQATWRFYSLSPDGASETDRQQKSALCWIMPLHQR